MDSSTLISKFLNYFESHSHTIVPSSSVIPYNDTSLLFVNSGMVQFKKQFTSTSCHLKRATSAQHCIRAGGKHNDLDDVGKDSYHHTYFTMLGNWSFGDYQKEEAIFYAFDFLTNVLKLNKERMYASYYKTQMHNDQETYNIWLKYLPKERILPFDEKDNFWEMGDTGPCGPCTEIHYDCREWKDSINESNTSNKRCAAHLVNMDDPDVIEIWNIVFIEFYRNQDKSLSSLSMKCIDTGLGMERVLRIVNNLGSNYLTDSFVKIIKGIEGCIKQENKQGFKNKIENKEGIKKDNHIENNKLRSNEYNKDDINEESNSIMKNGNIDRTNSLARDAHYANNHCLNINLNNINEELNKLNINESITHNDLEIYKDIYDTTNPLFKQSMAIRVIADHSRTISICLKDGVTFSSDGRGYVLRRIMRRAIKYCNELDLSKKMSYFVMIAAESISIQLTDEHLKMVENEENLFLKTLEKGKKILLKQKGTLSGKDAFLLYDTYGFPFDLTEIFCNENHIKIDKEEFEKIKEEMRIKSRKRESKEESIGFDLVNMMSQYEKTDDKYKYSEDKIEAKLLCVIKNNQIIYDESTTKNSQNEDIINAEKSNTNQNNSDLIEKDDIVYLVFDKTCFYSESGGQVSDTGTIEINNNNFQVIDTKKINGYIFHRCISPQLTFSDSSYKSTLKVNHMRREKIRKNHTATHLLNHSLRLLFTNIQQKGSLVDDKKLRFDFSHSKGLVLSELMKIEEIINELISKEINVNIQYVNLKDVDDSVIYLKEEKYPECVRIVEVERECKEMCGGTHVKNTREIKRFRILSEGSISNNVRRIIAYTNDEAIKIEEAIKRYENRTKKHFEDKKTKDMLEEKVYEKNVYDLSSDLKQLEMILDEEIPLIERLQFTERHKEMMKEKQARRKQILNNNIKRLKLEFINGNNNRIKCEEAGFIFECDLEENDYRSIVKDLNMLGGVLEKENMNGILYVVKDDDVFFAIRGIDAIRRGKMFCDVLKDGTVNGKDKFANGKGKIKY